MAGGNPGNPPQPAPSQLVKLLAQFPFVDEHGVLTATAIQFLTRLVGSVSGSGGIIDIIINNISNSTTQQIAISDVQSAVQELGAALGIPAVIGPLEARLGIIEREIGALRGVPFAAAQARLAALEQALAELSGCCFPDAAFLSRLSATEKLAVLAFNKAFEAPAAVSAAALILQVATVPQAAGTLNFGTGLAGSLSGGVLTISTSGGGGHDNFIAHGLSAPTTGSFGWINQGSATAANNTNGPMSLFYPNTNSLSAAFFGLNVPGSTPWTATAEMAISMSLANAHIGGIAITDGTKFLVFYMGGNAGPTLVTVQPWSNTGSAGSVDYQNGWTLPGAVAFWRIYNDSTNYNFEISSDGVKFQNLFQQGATVFLTATKVGFFMATNDNNNGGIAMDVFGWEAVTGTGTVLGW